MLRTLINDAYLVSSGKSALRAEYSNDADTIYADVYNFEQRIREQPDEGDKTDRMKGIDKVYVRTKRFFWAGKRFKVRIHYVFTPETVTLTHFAATEQS